MEHRWKIPHRHALNVPSPSMGDIANPSWMAAAAAAKSLQSCPTLWDPTDGSPRGSPVSGILQARTLEWVAISFSNAWKGKVKVKTLSRVWLLATPWAAAYQSAPSMGFSRQEYWNGVLLPSPVMNGRHNQSIMTLILPKPSPNLEFSSQPWEITTN